MIKVHHSLDGKKLPVGSQKSQVVKQMIHKVTRARKQTDKKLTEYTTALKAGKKKDVRKIADQYMKSYSGRLAAVVDENHDRQEDQRYTLSKCHKLAAELKPHQPCEEKVWLSLKAKKNGGRRVIQKFGIRRRSAQRMVRTLIQFRITPPEWQFTLQGVQKAIREVKGFDPGPDIWVARLDITDFYGSFTHGGLNELLWEIPNSITKNTLLGEGSNTHYYHTYNFPTDVYTEAARQGVPQGSVVSPLIGALAVSEISWEPDDGVVLINYVDDFLILAPSKEKLEKATFALDSAVTHELPGGNFHLKHEQFGTFSEGVEFLGHHLFFEDGVMVIEPTPSAISRLHDNVQVMREKIEAARKRYLKKGEGKQRYKFVSRLAELYSHMRGWRESFSECHPVFVDGVVKDIHTDIGEFMHGTNLTIEEVIKASSLRQGGWRYSEMSDETELDLIHEDEGDEEELN